MKTIAVIGASGLTSTECIYQALKDGNKVVGLTRNPANVKIPKGSGGADADKPFDDPNLKVIAGDVTKMSDVEKVFEDEYKLDRRQDKRPHPRLFLSLSPAPSLDA